LVGSVVSALALVWVFCVRSPTQTAGGGSDVGNGSAIAGIARYPDGAPAAGVTVRVRPTDYLPSHRDGTDSTRSADGVTDGRGAFMLDGLDSGDYRVELMGQGSRGDVEDCRVDGSPRDTARVEAELVSTGTIRLEALNPAPSEPETIWVQVYGLERLLVWTGKADLVVGELPPATYRVHIEDGGRASRSDPVVVAEGAETTVPPLEFGCASRACDSLALHTLLVANGLEPYIPRYANDTGRVVELEFSWLDESFRFSTFAGLEKLTALRSFRLLGRYLPDSLSDELVEALAGIEALREVRISWTHDTLFHAVPASIGRLTRLERLSLAGDSLDALPEEIGNLRNLRYLDISQNRLRKLPLSITTLPALETINFSYNKMCTLPEAFFRMESLEMIRSWGNPLCTLTPEQKSWLEARGGRAGPCDDSTFTALGCDTL
jgi:hypothetical protein